MKRERMNREKETKEARKKEEGRDARRHDSVCEILERGNSDKTCGRTVFLAAC